MALTERLCARCTRVVSGAVGTLARAPVEVDVVESNGTFASPTLAVWACGVSTPNVSTATVGRSRRATPTVPAGQSCSRVFMPDWHDSGSAGPMVWLWP